jgi:hypothetical protein
MPVGCPLEKITQSSIKHVLVSRSETQTALASRNNINLYPSMPKRALSYDMYLIISRKKACEKKTREKARKTRREKTARKKGAKKRARKKERETRQLDYLIWITLNGQRNPPFYVLAVDMHA